MAQPKATFPAFFMLWAKRMKWKVPDIHWQAVLWLEACGELNLFRCFRGFGKSTIIDLFCAWRLYKEADEMILLQSEADGTAYKSSRDVQSILRNHPLTAGMMPDGKGTVEQWWTSIATDPRNASMYCKGIMSNVTGSRARLAVVDDVEVPRNIQTPEAREKLRYRLEEITHILVPGGQTIYIGTPHTFETIYEEIEKRGANCLTIRLFKDEFRIEAKDADKLEYDVPFVPEFVFSGIYNAGKLLVEGVDYELTRTGIKFAAPPGMLIDCYAGSAWPERFDRAELAKRRASTRTINAWDSQYMLHSKPVTDLRLDPDRLREYNVEPEIRVANKTVEMLLGNVRISGMVGYWDVATGKVKGDASAFSLVLTDEKGHLYWHLCEGLTGDLATFADDTKINGGQVTQIKELVERYQIPKIVVEVNGPGSFAAKLLRTALKGMGCGVTEEYSVTNKQKRILDAFDAPLSSSFLWAHSRVLDGPAYTQMREFNPEITNAPDDYIDSGAGAILQQPVRIGQRVALAKAYKRENWRVSDGVHEVKLACEEM
ncbi:phage terminase large subunit [Leclercia sp. Marseille-Q4284]|uniref:phage terminase large subunit n=1 Tax=Leclercia sp. Marseille-Q4284 TaxID=2866582 RepID=UPI001CE41996|nr:phage terminase large subunit [Leclercia sp. Marseille-Q4284]